MLVGTGIQPDNIEKIRANWWYVAPRNGHVSLQSASSLIPLARSVGLVAYRSGYLHGFAAEASPISQALLRQVGRPAVDLVLAAPGRSELAGLGLTTHMDQWYDLEEGWRWTRQNEIVWTWTAPHDECDVRIELPFAMEICGDFAASSRIFVDDREVAVARGQCDLVADAQIRTIGPVTIKLVTPAPARPSDLYGTGDTRALGIAVRTCPTTA